MTVGNSVLEHVSVCDRETRTLPELTANDLGQPVANLGGPGQDFEQSLNLATIALKHSRAGGAIFYLSPFAINGPTLPDLQTTLFFRLASSSHYNANSIKERIHLESPLSPMNVDMPFSYGGVQYPTYDGLKSSYMLHEAQLEPCPSTLGDDHRFIEAFYWKQYLQSAGRESDLEDIAELQRIASEYRKTLLVVLLPVDVQDVESLNHDLAARISARVLSIHQDLNSRHVQVLDLSSSLPPEAFVNRWCACGHLAETGRILVAQKTAEAYHSLVQRGVAEGN